MKPYVSKPLPLTCLDYAGLIRKVGPANAALARYDGLLQSVINPGIMLSPLTNREAVLSLRIEGTQATVNEVLEYEAGDGVRGGEGPGYSGDRQLSQGLESGDGSPGRSPLDLIADPWHARRAPGQCAGGGQVTGPVPGRTRLARTQKFAIDQAAFVPPSPLQLLDHLEAFERYLSGDDLDTLVQVAVVHGQFELLHPFKDGNGKIGRLLIPLFLYQKRALPRRCSISASTWNRIAIFTTLAN